MDLDHSNDKTKPQNTPYQQAELALTNAAGDPIHQLDHTASQAVPAQFNIHAYRESIEASPAYLAYSRGEPYNKRDLSWAILAATALALPKNAALIINSSTGKDSSLMTALVIDWMRTNQKEGRPLRQTVVGISDTGSEFPEMAIRMRTEAEAINAYADQNKLPLKAEIVGPPSKAKLLVEIIGNGKPLPMMGDGKNLAPKDKASGWCMDRVKAGPLKEIVRQNQTKFPFFAQLIGTRSAESAKRKATTTRHAQGLPFGLTALSLQPATTNDGTPAPTKIDQHRIGVTPIIHWLDHEVTHWFKTDLAPWSMTSNHELHQIYSKGAGKGNSENPTECSITITKEGAISNACSDLTGTRMGCWMCMLSANRSLRNTAQKDARYRWLYSFYKYLYFGHKEHRRHMLEREKAGFSKETLFRKTYTFTFRYRLLVFLFRAERESGFTLLEPEDIYLIQELWRKSGIWNVTPKEARQDAERWKRTGKFELSFEKANLGCDALANSLGEGIPGGAFWTPPAKTKLQNGLELSHLAAVAGKGIGSPILPRLTSYVLRDLRQTDKIVVMVTDTPSVIGTKTNTQLLNGLLGAAWECVQARTPTPWERRLAGRRNFFYQTDTSTQQTRHLDFDCLKLSEKSPKEQAAARRTLDAIERNYQNQWASRGETDDVLARDWEQVWAMQELKHSLTPKTLNWYFGLVCQAVDLSDHLTIAVAAQFKPLRDAVKKAGDLIEADTPEGRKTQKAIRSLAKECFQRDDLWPLFCRYTRLVKALALSVQRGKINAALITKLCYTARLLRIDEPEAMHEITNIEKILNIQPS
jgi:3'-phosphoadenosine 5'-phosphosulfate sulfotransferase (PAPS reductase)/FAD synthetase